MQRNLFAYSISSITWPVFDVVVKGLIKCFAADLRIMNKFEKNTFGLIEWVLHLGCLFVC